MIEYAEPKSIDDICKEWDDLCEARQNIISQGRDISLEFVTAPCILRNVVQENPYSVLDVGCGTGYITSLLSRNVNICWGIDISENSIKVAKQNYGSEKACFFNCSMEDFQEPFLFDICASNMALTCDPNMSRTLRRMYDVLQPTGCIVILITHPFFWAKYWNIETESWFDYKTEIFIGHDFSVSRGEAIGKATYIHRPLQKYINEIISAGFCVECIEEPYPTDSVPNGYFYEYPRFLMIKGRKCLK